MPRDRLRRGRYSEGGRIYHVTTCTAGRRAVFQDPTCARLLIQRMRALHDEGWVKSLAWVVMPDHLHWLFELGDSAPLSAVIGRLKGSSASAVLAITELNGALWERGLHDRAIRCEDDIAAIARYIVANPLRAKLVKKIGDYPWWDAVWL
jgi:putative transposase